MGWRSYLDSPNIAEQSFGDPKIIKIINWVQYDNKWRRNSVDETRPVLN